MKRLLATFLMLILAGAAQAQNLLVNGGFETPPGTNVYYDGFDPTVADDVNGWVIFLGAADGSYVLVSPEASPAAGGTDLDMGVGPAGGGIQTAPGSRPAVTPGLPYLASLTTDNYFAPTLPGFFIDWFDGGGNLLSSSGGDLSDPNGPLTYDPYGQVFSVVGQAPPLTATAGVRFDGGNAGYNGLAADGFSLLQAPEPGTMALVGVGALAMFGKARRRTR